MSDAPAAGSERTNDVVDTAVDWPEFYTDPDTGTQHAWDDELPPDEDGYGYDDGSGAYTYRDLVYDRAGAAHMDIGEYLDHLRWRDNPLYDEPDGISPPSVDDGNGYGR